MTTHDYFNKPLRNLAQLKPGTLLAQDRKNKFWIIEQGTQGVISFTPIAAIVHTDPRHSHYIRDD